METPLEQGWKQEDRLGEKSIIQVKGDSALGVDSSGGGRKRVDYRYSILWVRI
jgi:hypothetical protein